MTGMKLPRADTGGALMRLFAAFGCDCQPEAMNPEALAAAALIEYNNDLRGQHRHTDAKAGHLLVAVGLGAAAAAVVLPRMSGLPFLFGVATVIVMAAIVLLAAAVFRARTAGRGPRNRDAIARTALRRVSDPALALEEAAAEAERLESISARKHRLVNSAVVLVYVAVALAAVTAAAAVIDALV